MKYLTYFLYIVLFEGLIFVGCGYAVFVLGHSGWWFMLAVSISASAYPPERWIFGTVSKDKEST